MALALREMSARYGNSPGGYVWAILEPVGTISIMAIGFSLLMRSPSLGSSFILFYASGYLAFLHYRELQSVLASAIRYSRALLQYPAVTWLDALTARFALNAVTNVLNNIVILGGVMIVIGFSGVIDLGPIVLAVVLSSLLGAGIGTLNCFLTGMSPVWKSVWKIINRPLMIASGVLYIPEDLPTAAMDILWWNPLIHVTSLMRTGVYPTYHPQFISIPYVLTVALVSLAVGLFFLSAHSSSIINRD